MQGADRLQLTFVAGYRSLSTQSVTKEKRKKDISHKGRVCMQGEGFSTCH